MSFFALVTAVSGLACSSSTMNFTFAPPKSLLTSSRYSWKPSTMSLPTCANMPVVGATNPMRSSSAAFEGAVGLKVTTPPNSNGSSRRGKVLVIVYSLVVVTFPRKSGGHQYLFFRFFSIRRSRPSLTDSFRDAHEPGWQIQDRQHVHRAEHVLPPRDQRAEIFAQAKDDGGADHAPNQRSRAAGNRPQQRVDRRGQQDVFGAYDPGGMRPQHAGKAAEAAGDDEGDVFVQPGIVAQNPHAKLAFADAGQTSSERRADQNVHQQQRHDKASEHQIEEGYVVRQVDPKLGSI